MKHRTARAQHVFVGEERLLGAFAGYQNVAQRGVVQHMSVSFQHIVLRRLPIPVHVFYF